ncbi:MAG: type I restriction endonuclease, partial [Candidatus Zixiibacteriota bacterium]
MTLKNNKAIIALASLDIDKYVRRRGERVEENVKIKIVIPLLERLGYNIQKDMDFEHHVRNTRVDIALLFNRKPSLLVETKDLDADLDHHINQALNYAYGKGINWVVLTNGLEIRLYKSFIEGVPPEDRKIYFTSLKDLPSTFSSLYSRISKSALKTGALIAREAELVRENITAELMIKDLAECKRQLFSDFVDQFKIRYKGDKAFKNIIDEWADRVNMDLGDPQLIDRLCTEGAYTLINRVLFLRICEDRAHIKKKLTRDALKQFQQLVEKPSRMLGLAFDEIGDRFQELYNAPLFDNISFEDIEWNEDTVKFIISTLGEHNFK